MTSPEPGKNDDSTPYGVKKAIHDRRKILDSRLLKSVCNNNDDEDGIKTRKRKHLRKKVSPARLSRSPELKTEESFNKLDSEESSSSSSQSQSLSSSSSSSSDQSSESEGVPVDILVASSEVCGREEVIRTFPCLSHGFASVCGRRREMEDAVTVVPALLSGGLGRYDFFGVYDGHGGSMVANACRDRLHGVLMKEIEGRETLDNDEIDWKEVMESCFAKMDEEFKGSGGEVEDDSASERTIGSTAVVALVGTDELVVANCGDSRAVLSRGGAAVPLSRDHKPDRPDEMERVEAAGGRVINWDGYRVLGVLATSRSIGDHYLKPYVISEPEVTVSKRSEEDEFLILASDGLWDVMSNKVACEVVRRCFNGQMMKRFSKMGKGFRGGCAGEAAAVLAELAMARGSKDNISVVVVELRKLSKNVLL